MKYFESMTQLFSSVLLLLLVVYIQMALLCLAGLMDMASYFR